MRAEQWYELLLRLFPRAWRRRFGEDAAATFARAHAAAQARGRLAGLMFTARESLDVLVGAAAERAGAVRQRRGQGDVRRRRRTVLERAEDAMSNVRADLRVGLRRLRRSPGFTAIALISLALGIGANTGVFTLVNAVILRRPPLERPEELLDIYFGTSGYSHGPFSYPDFLDLRDATRDVFSEITAMRVVLVQRDLGAGVEPIAAELVTGGYFTLRGLRPALGRLLGPEDDVARGAHAVVVISHAYWASAFARDPGVIGREIRLGGRPYTIVGVAPASYPGELRGFAPQVYAPMLMSPALEPASSVLDARGSHSLFIKARLAPGVTQAAANAALDKATAELRTAQPDHWQADNAIVAVPTTDVILHPMTDRVLIATAGLLTVVAGLVLLLACANLAGFLLAQAQDRRTEIAIRLALGATRGSLVRQLLAESVLLAVAGGAAGIGLSVLLLRALTAADLPLPFPITLDLAPDVRVLSFAVLVTVVAAVLFGLAPALQSTRADVSPVLREGATGAARGRFRLRELLVAAQVASSLVLLIAAGLFLRSFQARQDIDPGFGAAPAALVSAGLPRDRYAGEEGRLFIRTALERVRALPGVAAAGVTNNLHLDVTNTNTVDVNVDGHQPPAGRNAFQIDASVVDAGFFTAAAIPILRGRNFDEAADRPEGDPVVIVNQALVDRFWPGEDGIGRALRAGDEQWRIVGVARTAKIRLLGEASRPFIYMNVYQSGTSFPTFIVRTATDPNPTVGAVAGVLRTLDPQITINEMRTMDRHLAELLLPARLGAIVLVAISALALGLAVIGLYGMVSYAVARRTREVGIRMSIGADRGSVVRLMMASGVKLVAAGAGAGVLLAVALSSAVRGLLFGVTPLDPLTFVIVPAILCVVALLAAWLPARRASRIDPVRALRSQ